MSVCVSVNKIPYGVFYQSSLAKFHAQIWEFWKSTGISETAARRAKISSFLTPRSREIVYVQHLALWPMAKFHAQIWQFWKAARISKTAARRAKISYISDEKNVTARDYVNCYSNWALRGTHIWRNGQPHHIWPWVTLKHEGQGHSYSRPLYLRSVEWLTAYLTTEDCIEL